MGLLRPGGHVQDELRIFGSRLRQARTAAGLTLERLASIVHYSKGQLSKVETGHKRPSQELARLCDAALGAGGELVALVPTTGMPDTSFRRGAPTGRRHILTAGTASVLAAASLGAPHASAAAQHDRDDTLLEVSRCLFDQFRRLGQTAPPGAVLPALAEQTRGLRLLALRAGPQTRQHLLALGARYAEFAGWMAQEAGDDQGALGWTDHAVELSVASGDDTLASYARVRRALVAYYRGDAAETVALTESVRDTRLPSRILGLAAQQQAEGHALAGDYAGCMRELDRARDLLAQDDGDPRHPVLGPSPQHLSDPVAMMTGWCLLDLGRPREAAEAFDREMAGLSRTAQRNRARYGTRHALAYALAGEIEQACGLTADVLGAVHTVSSATVALDVRRLSRVLGRHPRNPAVKDVAPLLAFALSPAERAL